MGWVSGQYPQRLYKALLHSSTVLTVWDGDRLIGLIRALDDSEMLAQIHYVLVHLYEKHGFHRMEHGAAIQICNYSDKR